MNLKDFKSSLDRIVSITPEYRIEETQVVIPSYRIGSVGGRPFTEIKYLNMGFDWDSGKLFIEPTKTLRVMEDDEMAASKKSYNEYGKVVYENMGLKAEIKKLKAQIKELETK